MALRRSTPFDWWLLEPPHDKTRGFDSYTESASIAFLLETLRTHAEIAKVGRARFPGTVAQRNALWRDFRNYVHQAISNFEAAQSVSNRSAGLLYYYAALNLAKAELLDTHAGVLVNKRIGHGLSFNPTMAKRVSGDVLTVVDGVFPLLYERRTGHRLVIGTRLPINRLLLQVPEIGVQVEAVGGGISRIGGLLQLLAADSTHSWSLLAIVDEEVLGGPTSVTAKLLLRHYEPVDGPSDWQDSFAVSRRCQWPVTFYESRARIPLLADGEMDPATWDIVLSLNSILGMTTDEEIDAFVAPSLYRTRMLPMPPSLARYALTYYASSLVRYKPQMFDGRSFPEQAYLFDAIVRELALPMLQDVLSAIQGRPAIFQSKGSLRL